MKVLIVALFTLLSLSLSAQNVLMKGRDTIAFTGEQSSYYVELLNNVSAEELHFICTKYNVRFVFRNEQDLKQTMSEYYENGFVIVDWDLTKNEKALLKKYEKIQFSDGTKDVSKSSKGTISAGTHLQRAGRLKNASIVAITGSATTASVLIAADPINAPTAGLIGTLGAITSLGLNIAGNMELIAAGKAMNKE